MEAKEEKGTGNQEPNLRVFMDHLANMLLDALSNRCPEIVSCKMGKAGSWNEGIYGLSAI